MRVLRAVALGLGGLASAGAAGCASELDGGDRPEPPPAHHRPPAVDPAAVAGDGPGATFAVARLFLGDTDRGGSFSAQAWRDYGYDLDGIVSDGTGALECQPHGGAPPSSVHLDGDGGIDNAFGKSLLPVLLGTVPTVSADNDASLQAGELTFLFDIGAIGAQPSYHDLPTRYYRGGPLGSAPLWDGTDEWPVLQESLLDPTDITASAVVFPHAYVTGHIWVSGEPRTLEVALMVAGVPLRLTVERAVVTMEVASDLGEATNGILAGVLDPAMLAERLWALRGYVSPSLCFGGDHVSEAEQLLSISDILKDGTQDPHRTCDALSIGLGFTARAVEVGPILPPQVPLPDPCAP
ncbi:MAG: hypothetical protein IT373_30455 [Polyangiaceae bacterium]|nr:hypothetical protein [Polyangiaceae bacterium]